MILDVHDGRKTAGSSPAHHNHREGESRDHETVVLLVSVFASLYMLETTLPDETQWSRIGEASDVVTGMRRLWCKVEL